jgi:hypothetical protein
VSELVDPDTGELLDNPAPGRRGDQVPGSGGTRTPRRRWGTRVLLSNIPALMNAQPFARSRATVVETQDLGLPQLIQVQVRFALNASTQGNQPIQPFTPIFPLSPPLASLRIVTRRGLTPTGSVSTDTKTLTSFPQAFPWDILLERNLGIDLELVAGTPTSLWVEVIATPVNYPSFRDQIKGWTRNVTLTNFFAAVASPAQVTLLPANETRVQVIIVNTSTNADMIVDFGGGFGGASWAGPTGSIVLPRNLFASYESPIGGFAGGPITATWTAAPNGGALVTEGVYGG